MSFEYIKAIVILLLIIYCLYLAAKVIQKYMSKTLKTKFGKESEIKLAGIFYIDDTHKVVSIKHKKTQYLMLLGKNNNLLLDKNEDKAE